ncbi:hypothetical protein [Actinophytocola sp.]|jgi:hypothetical protein|uniref:hypothetical protein n=1 Tax=Actinophytocola sp. TaxID=1872138 RepID=UPI002EDAC160
MHENEKTHATTRPQLRFVAKLVAGLSGLGSVGVGLWLLGPAASYFLGLLLLLATVGLTWTAVFSPREEPIKRLERLIKALRGRRGR